MATTGSGNRRQVRMDVEVGTSGGAEVKKLSTEIRKLGEEGGESAVEFSKLADQLDAIAAQADAVKVVAQLESELDQTAAAAQQAAAQLDAVAQRHAEAAASAERMRQGLAEARAEEERIKTARNENQRALATLRAETDSADRSNQAYVDKVRELRLAIIGQNEALEQAVNARRTAKTEATAANAAEEKLSQSFKKVDETARASAAALRENQAALEAAQRAAGAIGVDTTNLLGSQRELTEAVRSTTLAVAAEQAKLEDLAAQEREAAEIQRAFARAAAEADAALAEQVATLKQVEAALERYNDAQIEAISAGERDLQMNERRLAAAAGLIEADRRLSAAQRELADSRNQNRQAALAEAQALLQQKRAAEESLAATQRLVSEAKSAGRVLDEAFSKTGVRALNEIEAEIRDTEVALSLLERKFKAGAISARDLERAVGGAQLRLAQLNAEAAATPAAPGVFERMSGSILNLTNRFGALSAAIATVGIAVKPVIDAHIELERLNRVLGTVTGSTQTTAETIAFLRDVAQTSGQSFQSLSGDFAKFAASAVNAGVPLETVKTTFQNAANAAGNLGLSSESLGRILNALGQIASKGTVSMEELKGQLGESLPGALALTAKSLGLTTTELTKLIESGELLAKDAIPAISDAMTTLASKSGEVTGLVAEWNKFKNVIVETGTTITGGAFGQAVGDLLGFLSAAVQRVSFGIAVIGESFTLVGKQIGTVVAAVVNNDFANLNDALAQIEKESADRLGGLANRIGGVGTAATTSAAGVDALTAANDRAAAASATASNSYVLLASGLGQTQIASDALAQAQERAEVAIKAANAQGAAAVTLWPQVVIGYRQAIDAATLAAQTAEKHAQAVKTEGEAMIQLTELAGNEINTSLARARAAEQTAVAVRGQADADRLLAEAYRQEIIDLQALAKAEGGLTEERAKAIKAIEDKLAKADADAAKTREAAELAERQAAALRNSSLALADNSKNLDVYRAALERAREAQLKARVELDAGIGSREKLKAADLEVAKAEGLVKDAIDDTAAALRAQTTLLRAKSEVTLAGLNAAKSALQVEIEMAEQEGNSALALQKKIELKEIEIKIIRATTEAKLAEVKATRLQIEADREELEAKGQLTAAKKAELDARLASAKAKEIEAQAALKSIEVLEKQIENLRIYGSESRSARLESAEAIDVETQALEANTAAQGRNSKARTDAQGFVTNAAGNRISLAVLTPQWVMDFLKQQGLSEQDAAVVAEDFVGTDGKVYKNPSYGGSTIMEALINAAKKFKGLGAALTAGTTAVQPAFGRSGGGVFGSGGTTPVPAGGTNTGKATGGTPLIDEGKVAGAGVRSENYRVRIDLSNGRTTEVNTASAEDARGLVGILRELETAQRRG